VTLETETAYIICLLKVICILYIHKRFLKNVRIREQIARQFRQYIVDAPLSWFHSGNHKTICSKEKASSRFLHASYTFCVTKKNLLIVGWVGVGQLLVAARQTVQCSRALIIVYLLLNRLRCGAAGGNVIQAQILYREQFPDRVVPNSKTFTSTV
jgi:hypothetical protein